MSYEPLQKPEEPLMSDEDDYVHSPTDRKRRCLSTKLCSCWVIVLMVFGNVAMFGLGMIAGKNLPDIQHGYLAPAGNTKMWMAANDSFGDRPSPESDALWKSLFPSDLGFVYHKSLSPNPSAIAVYHNLHCLNALRGVYYASLDGTLSHRSDNHSGMHNAKHVRHCLDYLRQSAICAADTNLEPIDMEEAAKSGDILVTGWGYHRTCRNIESVREWAEEFALKKYLH